MSTRSRAAMAVLGLVAAAALVGGAAALRAAEPGDGQAAGQAELPFSAERLRGLVKPERRAKLGAPLDGILAEIAVEEGDRVEKDALLARMDDSVQQASLERARVQANDMTRIRLRKLRLEEAEIQLERVKQLHDNDAAQQWEVRKARVKRDAAEAELAQAKQQNKVAGKSLQLERERLERHRVRAPFAGTVVRIKGEVGASATLGDPILTLISLDPLEAEIYLPVQLYGKLRTGRRYKLKAEQPVGRTLTGTLTYAEPLIDSASQTFRCVFQIPNPKRKLPAGFTVQLVWEGQAQSAEP